MNKGTLKQILLITDGCSNQGEDPSAVATLAYQQGVTVNVIGVLDDQQSEQPDGLEEVEEIAMSGGGVSQIVYAKSLSQTVQMVTKQAMTQTLQGVVNQELQQILGAQQEIEDLPPEKRGEIMEVVEDLGETCDLEVLVLVDTSASMHNKLPTVRDSLFDLSLSLNARMGKNRFSIYTFPGKRKDLDKVMDWTPKLDSISSVFPKLTSGGITPTGPALREAMQQFAKKRSLRNFIGREDHHAEESGY
ncbi:MULTISPECIES: vWA domain-containing protein [Pontibacillus]|uniref:VWA domain-containing protein n=1 Tax=Pontibacillus chungwhensis TaxID=265426 RepID=A0ABY8UXH3_9BACI|nr:MULTISPECIES: VWA domain-containing protein [Pontibacillus]MCD5326113.1 VWA domain-containing protein [Pontibacillus sp. HN14]WIF98212.1 VWA domain-containing protein [Pontibacillus chungwhensis]